MLADTTHADAVPLDVFAMLFADAREGRADAFLSPPDPRDAWTAVEVDAGPLFDVHSQAVGSFDGSARVQVMVGEANIGGFGFGPNPDPKIYVYRLLGPASDPASWERTLVDTTGTHEASLPETVAGLGAVGDGLGSRRIAFARELLSQFSVAPLLLGRHHVKPLRRTLRRIVVAWWSSRARLGIVERSIGSHFFFARDDPRAGFRIGGRHAGGGLTAVWTPCLAEFFRAPTPTPRRGRADSSASRAAR